MIKAVQYETTRLLSSRCDHPDAVWVLLTAPTGIAAHNLDAATIHNTFSIGVDSKLPYTPLGEEKINSLRAKYRNVQMLIVDEMDPRTESFFKAKLISQDISINGMQDPDPINYQNICYDLSGELVFGSESNADFSPSILEKKQAILDSGHLAEGSRRLAEGSRLRILTNSSMAFSSANLTAILAEHGFETMQTFLLDKNGHRTDEPENALLLQVV